MSDMNFSTEEELPIMLLEEYELNSHIKGYHAYIMKWNPTLGEFLKARVESENEFDKFVVAVEKCDVVVGHLSKRKTGRFAKTVSCFLRGSNENSYKVEVTGEKSEPWRWGTTPDTL